MKELRFRIHQKAFEMPLSLTKGNAECATEHTSLQKRRKAVRAGNQLDRGDVHVTRLRRIDQDLG